MTSMKHKRYLAAAVLDNDDNMWVLGGTANSKPAEGTEIFRYQPPPRTSRWRRGRPLPEDLRDSGLQSHCAVRLNRTHVFIAGGFANRRLSDLWHFDYESGSWTELNSAAIRDDWPLNGQSAILTQYGLLAYGGVAPYGPRDQGHDLWLLDLFGEDWVSVPIPQSLSVQDDQFK